LQQASAQLDQADAFVTITTEFKHAPSPGLLNIPNHFGSSKFSFKPSCVVTYSAGKWGGTRAALALRPILFELECLPVSAMTHVPKAQEVLK
jgi:chromate reductase, NAD(P)H dehydrogenase (quinone)